MRFIALTAFLVFTTISFAICGKHTEELSSPIQLNIHDKEVQADEYVVVPVVNASHIPPTNIYQFQISYNGQVLSFENVQNINLKLGNAMFSVSEGDESSAFTLNGFSMTASSIPQGSVLFELVFHFCHNLLACAQNGSMSQLDFVQDDTYLVFWDSENYQDIFYDIVHENGSVYASTPAYSVELLIEGNGSIEVNEQPYTSVLAFVSGSVIELNAIPDAGWVFDTWSGDLESHLTPMNLLVDSHKMITATFVEEDLHPPPDDDLFLYNLLIDYDECFYAARQIVTAGNGETFIVLNQGKVTLVAGESIHLLPGTEVQHGGQLHAFLQYGDDPCDDLENKNNSVDKEDIATNAGNTVDLVNEPLFKVFPNPSRDYLNIQAIRAGGDAHSRLELFDMMGNKVLSAKVPPAGVHSFPLYGLAPGTYLLRIVQNEYSQLERIIKQ